MASIQPVVPTPADFISRLTIEQPNGDGSVGYIPFALWPSQVGVLETFDRERLVIILKARQLGISWLACAYALWLCVFHAVRSVMVFSKGEDEANEMVRRISGMWHRHSDKAGLPTLEMDNTQEMRWSNGSRIRSQPATKTAGSSFTASMVIADEFAKLQWAEELYTAMKPTIDGGGKLFIISSAQGQGNLFHSMWAKAQRSENNYKPVFLPWRARPDRDDAWYAAVERDAVLTSLLKQEYPASPEDAFEGSEIDALLPSMLLWDGLKEALPQLGPNEPMVLAADAAVTSDSFGLVGVTRHPARHGDVAVRFAQEWKPPPGGQIDFQGTEDWPGPERVIRKLKREYNIVQLAYDPYQLADMAQRLTREAVVWCKPFNQMKERLEADRQLLDLILQKRLAHDGNEALRRHIENANRKPDPETRKLRIVKRAPHLKIDLAVCLSMASAECLRLAL